MPPLNDPFNIPAPPAPLPAPAPPPAMSTSGFPGPVNCPSGMQWNGYTCVPSGGGNAPPPAPSAPGTCPPGQVWRADVGACEAPDARSQQGRETCTGPQPQCPPGQGVWCDFDTATWKCAPNKFSADELCRVKNKQRASMGKPPLPCGGGGGGRGGRGGVGGKGPTPFGPGPGSEGFGADLERYIRDALAAPSRYTPQALQAMYGEIARQSSGAITRGERAVRQNAAARGMQRAGSVGAALRGVQDAAEQQRGASTVQVQTAKITADYQDKMGALDRAQKYLDSLRDNEYRYTLLAEQRRQFDANLALGYASLAQQRSMLQMQLQSAWDMLRAQQGFNLLGQGV